MNSRQKKRHALFNIFSSNLEHIKSFLNIQFQKKGEAYICPLSYKIFDRDGLNEKYDDQLTFEHAPPESLGGKIVALTSKDLNSKSGHTLDHQLKTQLEIRESIEGKNNLQTKFKLNKSISLPGEISIPERQFHFKPRSMHQGAKEALEILKSGKFTLDYKIPQSKNFDIALIRTAFLIAFSKVGYSLFFGGTQLENKAIGNIREQILEPEKRLFTPYPILIWDFPDGTLGVNIVHNPKPIRSILVIFDLELTSRTRVGVFLPGPDDYGLMAIEELNKLNGQHVSFDMETLPNDLDLTNKQDSLEFLQKWGNLNGWTKNNH